MYASSSVKALRAANKGNLIGFGSAPEGLENNEVVYELLADMGWSSDSIDLDDWMKIYCEARYGGYPDAMEFLINGGSVKSTLVMITCRLYVCMLVALTN